MATAAQSASTLVFPSLDSLALQIEPAMLSGAVGGPLVVGMLTPQRNAMTLAAKDVGSTYLGLYGQVFARGLAQGFRGGSRPMLAAIPQFTAIGPVYLAAEKRTGSPAVSMLMASVAESLCTFSAQVRNAQIQFNATRTCATEHVALQPLRRMVGPGFLPHVGRNMFAMMGIRLLSPHSLQIVERMPGASRLGREQRLVAADLASSVCAATLSMPLNHIFSWAACTPELERLSYWQRCVASAQFLVGNYQRQGAGLFARDLGVRISYTGLLFTVYRAVERRLEEM